MPRPKRIMPQAPKEQIVTTDSFKRESATAVMDEPKEEVHFNKEVVVVTDSTKPRYEKIRFVNNRDPGRPLDFFYASKTHPLKSYNLMDGKEYDLPIEVILHLEGSNPKDPNTCHAMIYGDKYHENQNITKSSIVGYKSLYQCKSLSRGG